MKMRWCCLVGLLLASVLQSALAVPLLEVERQRIFKSSFCQVLACRFLQKSGGHTDGIDLDQYLYRLRNGLFFVVTRLTPFSDDPGLQHVSSVSLETFSTPKHLRRLEAFLPKFVAWATPENRGRFTFDFWRKCAQPGTKPSPPDPEIRPASQRIYTLNANVVIACTPITNRSRPMLSVTLYLGTPMDWIDRLFSFQCGFNPRLPCRHF